MRIIRTETLHEMLELAKQRAMHIGEAVMLSYHLGDDRFVMQDLSDIDSETYTEENGWNDLCIFRPDGTVETTYPLLVDMFIEALEMFHLIREGVTVDNT